METYSTTELLQASGLTLQNFKILVHRRQLVLSSCPGTGTTYAHLFDDVVQARHMVVQRRVGTPAHRAALFWSVVRAIMHEPGTLLILAHREDASDTDFRVVKAGDDAGWSLDGAPSVAAVVNIDALIIDVRRRLAGLRA